MDSLSDEIIPLIFYELQDPGPLAVVSRRLNRLSQDPYVRAQYFLARHGPLQALYCALGRGRLLTERTLDILISSGAHISRYLIQVAMHHFFHTQSHFIKTSWVRSVPLTVFTHFLKLASERYGDIPRGKSEDDGSILASFLKESRFPSHLRRISWETIRDILETYHFIPFSAKDPILMQFPLVLAIEPRLLPYAVANGFYMDSKYRDSVFRKIFERPPSANDRTVSDVVENVKELSRLDPTMFVSRTVAAEVCMEAKSNEVGYAALKQLDKSGDLLFDLRTTVEDLIKLFLKAPSVTSSHTNQVLRHLFKDFPSSDPSVRLVILLSIFAPPENTNLTVSIIKSRLEPLRLGPLTRKDLLNLFINPFMQRFTPLLDYMETAFENEDGSFGLPQPEINSIIEEVAAKCLERECKGKMLKKLYDAFHFVPDVVINTVLKNHRLNVGDLPPSDDELACEQYLSQLCRGVYFRPHDDSEYFWDEVPWPQTIMSIDVRSLEEPESSSEYEEEGNQIRTSSEIYLGDIGRESLTTMIRQDEIMPSRSRRRMLWTLGSLINSMSGTSISPDSLLVPKWVKNVFGPRHSATAVFMSHAVVNNNAATLRYFFSDPFENDVSSHVPVTLRHFELLAHLGRAPSLLLYQEIEAGAEFFKSEEDYLLSCDPAKLIWKPNESVKQVAGTCRAHPPITPKSPAPGPSVRRLKRPRRSAASVKSYAVPDSDDEPIIELVDEDAVDQKSPAGTHLHLWIYHLGELLKAEQSKYREIKKRFDATMPDGTKARAPKSEFFKSLTSALRSLKKRDDLLRFHHYTHNDTIEPESDDEYRGTRSKRRRTN